MRRLFKVLGSMMSNWTCFYVRGGTLPSVQWLGLVRLGVLKSISYIPLLILHDPDKVEHSTKITKFSYTGNTIWRVLLMAFKYTYTVYFSKI